MLAHARPNLMHLVQGEHAVSGDSDIALTTVLGSCVAACMWDARACVGGMNHFLLPGVLEHEAGGLEQGVHAMELLINALLQGGARRDRLEAKLFGGARMMKNLSDIGGQNAAFAIDFLRQERIVNHGGSLGGDQARRVRFWPVTGKAQQLLLGRSEQGVFAQELRVAATLPPKSVGDVEFF